MGLMPHDSKRTNLLMAAAVLALGLLMIAFGERQTVNNGFGWDGIRYAAWAKDFYGAVVEPGVGDYYARRILPSLLVHAGMRLLSVPPENVNVFLAFSVYDMLMLALSAYLWGKVADEMEIPDVGKWFGFLFLFVSYANLKWNYYSPVWTDPTAMAQGFLAFYFYLKDRPLGLAFVIFLAGFTWPTSPMMFAPLLAFPRRSEEPRPVPRRLNLAVAAGAALLTGALLLYLTDDRLPERLQWLYRLLWVDTDVLYLSIAGVVAFVFLALRGALNDGRVLDPRAYFRYVSWGRVGLWVAAYAASALVRYSIWDGQYIAGAESPKIFVMLTLLSGVTEPLVFLIAHVVYFGPWFLLFVIFWRRFCRECSGLGLGFSLLLLANVFLSISSHSRWLINVLPAFLAVLIKCAWPVLARQNFWVWAALSLIFSRAWYVMNVEPFVDDGTMECLLRFPLQHQMMAIGTYMNGWPFVVQSGAVLLTGVMLYLWSRKVGAFATDDPARELP